MKLAPLKHTIAFSLAFHIPQLSDVKAAGTCSTGREGRFNGPNASVIRGSTASQTKARKRSIGISPISFGSNWVFVCFQGSVNDLN